MLERVHVHVQVLDEYEYTYMLEGGARTLYHQQKCGKIETTQLVSLREHSMNFSEFVEQGETVKVRTEMHRLVYLHFRRQLKLTCF